MLNSQDLSPISNSSKVTSNDSNYSRSDELVKNREEALRRKQEFLKKMERIPAHEIDLSLSPVNLCPLISAINSTKPALSQKKLVITPTKELMLSPQPARTELPVLKEVQQITTLSLEFCAKDEISIKSISTISREVKDLIKSLSGKPLQESFLWVLPAAMYTEFKSSLLSIPHVHLNDIPRFVSQLISDSGKPSLWRKKDQKSFSIEDLPSEIRSKLYSFQLEGVRFLIEHSGRGLIGDEMGVGKTIQALAAAYVYRSEWPVLIVCPASIKLNWREEILKWLPMVQRREIYVLDSKKSPPVSACIWIASYNMATSLESTLKSQVFEVFIADECHYLKNFSAKRTKTLVPMLQKAKRVILLSGTPLISRPAELYNLLTALRPNLFRSFKEFASRYCDPKFIANHWDYSGSSNKKELYTLLSSNFMIRRLKSDVLSQLPSKIRQKIEISTDKKLCKEIRQMYAQLQQNRVEGLLTSAEVNQFVSQAYVATARAKIKGVQEYVNYLLENDCKFLIFGHHVEMLDAIQMEVEKAKIGFIRIDGSKSAEYRVEAVKEFQSNKLCKAAILSILAAGIGLTLTAASVVIIAEMAWSPSVMIQAEDRAHRIGQERVVNIHYLFGPATLDEYIWPKIHEKLSVITTTLDNDSNPSTHSLMNPECKIGLGDFQGLFDDIESFSGN